MAADPIPGSAISASPRSGRMEGNAQHAADHNWVTVGRRGRLMPAGPLAINTQSPESSKLVPVTSVPATLTADLVEQLVDTPWSIAQRAEPNHSSHGN